MLVVVGIVGFRYEYMYVYGMKGGWIQDRQRITGGKGGGIGKRESALLSRMSVMTMVMMMVRSELGSERAVCLFVCLPADGQFPFFSLFLSNYV